MKQVSKPTRWICQLIMLPVFVAIVAVLFALGLCVLAVGVPLIALFSVFTYVFRIIGFVWQSAVHGETSIERPFNPVVAIKVTMEWWAGLPPIFP